MSLLRTTAVTVACAVALNLTGVGRAFAVWCQADAPITYSTFLERFVPWVTQTFLHTGTSIEDAVTQAGAGVRGEVLKATATNKEVTEGIASYEEQQALQTRAVELKEAMQQPATTCQSMAAAASLASADQSTQVAAFRSQLNVMAKADAAGNTNTMKVLDAADKQTNDKFCTPEEQAQGICSVRGGAYKDLAGADQDAMFLFQGADGSSSFEGNGQAQADAADSYINRIVAGLPPQALPEQGEDFYRRHPQARAYAELARRYNAMISMPAYSLNQIKELHRTQPGLGTDTMLATVNVPGFQQNKADMSMAEAVERFVAMKFSPDSVRDLATATNPNLILRDMAQMNAFELWMSYQGMLQSQRTEGIQAHQLALLADQTLRPQIEAQRAAAAGVKR